MSELAKRVGALAKKVDQHEDRAKERPQVEKKKKKKKAKKPIGNVSLEGLMDWTAKGL